MTSGFRTGTISLPAANLREPTADYAFGFVPGVTEFDGWEVTYDYDELARLVAAERTGAFDQSYTYDDADNRLTLKVMNSVR